MESYLCFLNRDMSTQILKYLSSALDLTYLVEALTKKIEFLN